MLIKSFVFATKNEICINVDMTELRRKGVLHMCWFKRGHWVAASGRVLSWLVAFCLSACASSTDISVRAEAEAVINRDHTGKPLSVAVRLYQLRSEQAFSQLTYESLTSGKGESVLLGGDLLGMKDMLMLPGGVVQLEGFTPDAATRFIAVLGFFRQPDKAYWRLLFPLAAVQDKGLLFRVQDCYLVAVQPAALALPDQVKGMSPGCRR